VLQRGSLALPGFDGADEECLACTKLELSVALIETLSRCTRAGAGRDEEASSASSPGKRTLLQVE